MRIVLNGSALEIDESASVAMLVAAASETERGIAVAVNDELVVRSTWNDHRLSPGDRVELLTAAQGG